MPDILLVDDDENIRIRLTKLLESNGHHVTVAKNGQEGLDRFSQLEPSIVLVDIQMPEMDGLELLEAIKKNDSDAEVIVVTGTGGEETAIDALRKDAFSYIRKPIDFEELNIEINRALDKQELQKELAQSKKLAAIGEMSAGIMHEINNPNTFIKGNIEFLERAVDRLYDKLETAESDTKAPILEEMTESLGAVQRGSERIEDIVNKIKLFARKQTSPSEYEAFNPVTIIEKTLSNMPMDLDDGTVTFTQADSLKQSSRFIKADPNEFKQVIKNLVDNALNVVKNSKDPAVALNASCEGDDFKLSVSDSGPGIPDEVEQKMYDPFFTTKRMAEGTGLGLSIVKGIVDRADGEISVTSTPGEGTTFEVCIPLHQPEH